MNQFDFIKSNRFWALILGSASAVLIDPELTTQKWYANLGKFLGLVAVGFIGIRTLDRGTEVLSNRSLPVDDKEDESSQS